MKTLNKKNGQTLIEIALALGIATIVIVALVILAANGLRNAQDTIRRTESTKMANAGIEAVIYYKNAFGFSSSDNFPQGIGEEYCYGLEYVGGYSTQLKQLDTNCTVDGGYELVSSPSTNLTYNRKISVIRTDTNIYTVYTTVKWVVAGNKINSVSVKRILTNWK